MLRLDGNPSGQDMSRTEYRDAVANADERRLTIVRGATAMRQPARENIPLHRQLADLGVQYADLAGRIPTATLVASQRERPPGFAGEAPRV